MASEYEFDFNGVNFLPNETTSVKVVKGGSIYYLPYTTTKSTFDRLFSYDIPSEINITQSGVTSSLYRLPMVTVGVTGYTDILHSHIKIVAEIKNSSGRTLFSKTITSGTDTDMFPVYPGCTSVTYTLSQKNNVPIRIWDMTTSFTISNAPTTKTINVPIESNKDCSAMLDLTNYEAIIRYKKGKILLQPYHNIYSHDIPVGYLLAYSGTNANCGFFEDNGTFYANSCTFTFTLNSYEITKTYYMWINAGELFNGVMVRGGGSTSNSTFNILHACDIYRDGVLEKTAYPSISSDGTSFTCEVTFEEALKEHPSSVNSTRSASILGLIHYCTGISFDASYATSKFNGNVSTCYKLWGDTDPIKLYPSKSVYMSKGQFLLYQFKISDTNLTSAPNGWYTNRDNWKVNNVIAVVPSSPTVDDSIWWKLNLPSLDRFKYMYVTNTMTKDTLAGTIKWHYDDGSASYADVSIWGKKCKTENIAIQSSGSVICKHNYQKMKNNDFNDPKVDTKWLNQQVSVSIGGSFRCNVPGDQSFWDDRWFGLRPIGVVANNGEYNFTGQINKVDSSAPNVSIKF